jgi:glyceraldehyde 3-phosphate dehydrogenase
MTRVAINGLGRIGRATFKSLLNHPQLELAAVNDLVDPENLAYLLNFDTVYGRYEHHVSVDKNHLKVQDKKIPVYEIKDPAELPWSSQNVELVFECTGVFTKKEQLQKHIDAGARFVLLSAPAKSDDIDTVVYGVNKSDGSAQILSCASCTTNCITPVVEIMSRNFGVQKAMMTTIHAYTSSQSIVDGPSKKWRRGRAGAANFVPTSTGAAIATTKALPQLKGKFDGVAVRGPIPVGSIADLVFVTEKEVTVDQVNETFRKESETDRYRNVLGASDDELVSADIIKDPRASIVDLNMTQVVAGNMVKIMSWYDNEWGYTQQMIREAVTILK